MQESKSTSKNWTFSSDLIGA